jgi:hypothetical protein
MQKNTIMKYIFYFLGTVLLLGQEKPKPEATEYWDPEPVVATPAQDNLPPSDAIVLFDGSDLSKWRNARGGGEASWIINDNGSMTVTRNGGIETIDEHGSIQLHIEWRTPTKMEGKGQGRGNSGIIFQRRYEVQILDSYNNRTYSNGQAASIYKQYAPLVNASKPPGEWQTYDIIFTEPEFDKIGIMTKRGRFTVFHNGILVQNNVEILGTTEYIGMPKIGKNEISGYMGKNTKKNLYLQDHGNPVEFRNIWMRKL